MPNYPPLIYIAGPLHAPSIEGIAENVRKADRVAFIINQIAREMETPVVTYSPHVQTGIWLTEDERREEVQKHEDLYMAGYVGLIESGKVDAIYHIGNSPGTRLEMVVAAIHRVPVLRSEDNAVEFLAGWKERQSCRG